MIKKKIIYGCEERGDHNLPYLTRYTLFSCKRFQICLHIFHRSDADEHHDHPWNFLTFILWRGYVEETACLRCKETMSKLHVFGYEIAKDFSYKVCGRCKGTGLIKRKVFPLTLLFRKAEHRHRVVLINNKPAVTLVIMGKQKREWGFFTSKGWVWWQKYFIDKKC